jgi:hypothetical protein
VDFIDDFIGALVTIGEDTAPYYEAIAEVEKTACNYAAPSGQPRRFEPLRYDLDYHRLMLKAVLAGPSIKRLRHDGPGVESADLFKESVSACAACGDRLKILRECGGCGKVVYCSPECQKQDWKAHKKACKKRADKKKAAKATGSSSRKIRGHDVTS